MTTYTNPVVRGFHPDPSVCMHDGRFYMVTSSFQYFPGVPIFISDDLINWQQVGNCLTRVDQLDLSGVRSSGGVFAPTIRWHGGRFYMVTTILGRGNCYTWTEDPAGEWSDPVYVDQGGIDPSLYFEDDKVFFTSSTTDDQGVPGIAQCLIDIATGRRLSPSRVIWRGSGGRFVEGPHLYRIGGTYYLLAAEGGTEYGHMVVCAKGLTPDGPFESDPHNPILTNRDKGGYPVQGVGHGDLVRDMHDNWWMVHLGFRQIGFFEQYHHLGRETFIEPVTFTSDGWMHVGDHGAASLRVQTNRIGEGLRQRFRTHFDFSNTNWNTEWCTLRVPKDHRYQRRDDVVRLLGTAQQLTSSEGTPPHSSLYGRRR